MANKPRRGAVRKTKKGPTKGSGGQGRKALEGRGPTPKAQDRPYHVAAKRAQSAANRDRGGARPARSTSGSAPRRRGSGELVTGRNSVVEALRARVPATTLYLAGGLDMDARVREALALAHKRELPVLEVTRAELDRMTSADTVHQGLVLAVPEYEYAHPRDLLDGAAERGDEPLIVALDGVTDPRNLGAILRSAGAFGAHGVVVPQRRSVPMTATAWKVSAGAAARVPVARATNLTQALKDYRAAGCFLVGLDTGGADEVPGLELADGPLVLVVGSEGKGLSRLVTETCDTIASIPIGASTESLNASVAASVALYEVSRLRRERRSGADSSARPLR